MRPWHLLLYTYLFFKVLSTHCFLSSPTNAAKRRSSQIFEAKEDDIHQSSASPRRGQLLWIARSIEKLKSAEGDDSLEAVELISCVQSLADAQTTLQVAETGRWLEKLPLETQSQEVRERLIRATATSGLLSLALNISETLFKKGLVPSENCQESVCSALRRVGRIKWLTNYLQDLGKAAKLKGSKVSQISYNILLACLCDSSVQKEPRPNWSRENPREQRQEAVNWLNIEKTSTHFGLLPDVISYNTILAAAFSNQTLVDQIRDEMKARNVAPDTRTFNSLLKSKLHSTEDMLAIWEEMAEHQVVVPDRFTVDLILLPLYRENKQKEINRLLDHFVSANADTVVSQSFAAFFVTIIGEGCVKLAQSLFDLYMLPSLEKVATGGQGNFRLVKPETRHFNLLIEGYSKQLSELRKNRQANLSDDLYRGGWSIYNLMLSKNISTDDYTMTSMTGLCRTPEELTELLVNYTLSFGDQLNSVVLRAVCTMYGSLGDPSSACWLFANHVEAPGSARNWNVLLGTLSRNTRLDIFNSTAARVFPGSPPSYFGDYLDIVDGSWCSDVALDSLRMVEEPNSQTYCIVAKAAQLRRANSDLARKLFRDAINQGVSADGRFVNAILRCFGSDIDAALDFWKREIRAECARHENRNRWRPSSPQRMKGKNLMAAFHGLLYVSGRASRPDIAVRLVYAMTKEGLEPSESSLNSYRSGKRTEQTSEFGNGFGQRIKEKLKLLDSYEAVLEVECLKYDKNDRRRANEKRVRIIV